ncbi:hypothetical protein D9758_018081 [Tetrapyrgos nigripes]|uniref:Uncharacterized protein n=1 Tax=Tetrapyrgos nigripes TaxID=182062 RepID=A0A8H5BBL8_9AGAR|nr:hypothetical protein D9758_018081 [Tetrapyrgos nigripes]
MPLNKNRRSLSYLEPDATPKNKRWKVLNQKVRPTLCPCHIGLTALNACFFLRSLVHDLQAETAGSVIASRLNEDYTKKVLVIEAGVDDTGNLNIEVPFAPLTLGTAVDWNYTTVAALSLSLGLHFLGWTLGSEDYYDKLISITGNSGWGWASMQGFFKKVPSPQLTTPPPLPTKSPPQTEIAPATSPSPTSTLNLTKASSPAPNPCNPPLTLASNAVNDGDSIGFGYNQVTAGGGSRVISATAHLRPALNNRNNNGVVLNTRATRLLKSVDEGLMRGFSGAKPTFTASQEVSFSPGHIGTTQILLHSGIGLQADLGSKTIVNAPQVKMFETTPSSHWSVNHNSTYDDSEILLFKAKLLMNGFLRLPQAFFTPACPDLASGPNAPNTELIFVHGFVPLDTNPLPATGHFMSIVCAVVHPTSVGSIKISPNTDTSTQPLIDCNISKLAIVWKVWKVWRVWDPYIFIHISLKSLQNAPYTFCMDVWASMSVWTGT